MNTDIDPARAYRAVVNSSGPATRSAIAKRLLRSRNPAVANAAKRLEKAKTLLARTDDCDGACLQFPRTDRS